MSSDRVEQLDPPAEVFYRRLMSKVDDFGLYDARPSILRASLYPLRIDRVREADITRWIAACEKAGLIALYQHDGKPFMQMLDTEWQTRSEPKFDLPPWGKGRYADWIANNCLQPFSPVTVFGGVVEDEDEGGGDNARGRAKPTRVSKPKKGPIPEDFGLSERVSAWAQEKGFEHIGEHLEAFVRKCKAKGYEYVDFDLAFMEAIREDWAKLRGRGANGSAPAGESSTTSTVAVQGTKQWIAEHTGPIEQTPEQREDTARRLRETRERLKAAA